LVYIEWYTSWQSFAQGSAGNKIIFDAGGINIAAEIDQPAPVLSPEFVVEKNPDIILRMAPSEATGNLTAFEAVRNEILNRPELQAVKAVKNGKVYVYDPIILEGIRYPIGLLQWAKWLHPELFADVDPDAVHAQLVQRFFGLTLEGTFVSP
ncbi:ABC transporter substrate-binding protein, partial [Candidatus Bathyarchaeota archaeon]|nr:ABC transporter substrate-binding protein [Candidatus Bathyarchaeota archaeon]